ncbi:phage portal protein [Pelagibacterium sp. 26DY04]|uniref:phage portal protein n=1 Tax=Pelagibacterium sp. 26DY04 TaxID=2967130 RepID=UPI00281545B5|nr:phage portal protein [Pelagibacterium sp. 26DY04]WMT88057.1 phage portal protein [Pelagibacterium sp. 26DY04]
MANWLERLKGGRTRAPIEAKAAQTLFTLSPLGIGGGARKGFVALANEGFARNPVVYRCVRLVAESAARVPLEVHDGERVLSEHPLLDLLGRPNRRQDGKALLESVFSYLQIAGNAYLDAAIVEGEVKGLYGLRPDRMAVIAGKDGWPVGYAYTAGGKTQRLMLDTEPVARVLHLSLFDPLDDHYGLAPLAAAQGSLETHNAATSWNRALLENAARPSGALVYNAAAGNLTEDQYQRLKGELEEGFTGALNAGRPMVLEGGLDWKAIALTPRDMDFLEAKNAAAREIALAFGVPPMLLGIPGDNTYANYAEASRALWRQTVIPLVNAVAGALGHWLSPAFGGVELVADFDMVEALASDRAKDWERVGNADFLTDDEKRELLGFGRR